ncbi:MAG: MFS transporter [Fimbriimonadaceae bacterium]|nr:MFS transporter [Fimbriimonadaceae bacterium]
MAEARRQRLNPTVLWLSVGFFFLFAGAAQQQFQSPFFKQALGWSPSHRAAVLAVVYLSFGLSRLRIGALINRIGEQPTLLLGSLTYALFCFTVYSLPPYPLLLLAAVLWGVGAAANWGTSAVMVLNASQDARYGGTSGVFMGLTKIGFAAGILVLARVFSVATAHGGPLAGRAVWLVAGLLSLLGVALLTLVPSRQVRFDPPSFAAQWAVMRSRRGSAASLFLFLGGFGFGSMLGVLSDKLSQALTGGNGLYLAAFFAVAGCFVNLVGGPLSDRIGRPRTLQVTFLLAAGGLFGAWGSPDSTAALAVCALFLGLQAGLVPTLAMAMVGDLVGSAGRQNAYAALFFWRDLGVAAGLLLPQKVHEASQLSDALLATALLTLVCAVLSARLARQAEGGR